MAIEIVDFPINSMVIFHSYVNVYRRVGTVANDTGEDIHRESVFNQPNFDELG